MAMDEAIMLDVLKALTRVEMKVDMMMAEDAKEDAVEEEPSGSNGYMGGLEFEMPPFVLD